MFQSPDGDFVYSDWEDAEEVRERRREFQSPDGDFVYSDYFTWTDGQAEWENVSIP